jgi:Na+-transporting methylmalonyl-CoA/oxaloacetate decarboxylase gamma subunit
MTWSDWFNKTSMQSFRSFLLSLIASVVVLWFSGLAGAMLMDKASAGAALNRDPGIRAAAQTTETSHHSYGMQIVTAVLTFLSVAIGANVVGQGVDRFSSREHAEAKERGRVSGMAAAAVAAQVVQDAKNGQITKERPAMQVNTEHAEITQEAPNADVRTGE